VSARNNPPDGRNRFESPSLLDSLNLTEQRQMWHSLSTMVLDNDVKDSKKEHKMKLDMVIIVC